MHLSSHCLHYLFLKVIGDGYLIPHLPIVYFNVQYSLLLTVLATSTLFLMLPGLCFLFRTALEMTQRCCILTRERNVNPSTVTFVGEVANVACIGPATFWVVLYCHRGRGWNH